MGIDSVRIRCCIYSVFGVMRIKGCWNELYTVFNWITFYGFGEISWLVFDLN